MGCKRTKGNSVNKDSQEYREKRWKNNNAVKKSRDKTKKKAAEASQRVQQLMMDNQNLKMTIDNMTQELQYLKDLLFSNDLSNLNANLESDIHQILNEENPSDLERVRSVVEEVKRINSMNGYNH